MSTWEAAGSAVALCLAYALGMLVGWILRGQHYR